MRRALYLMVASSLTLGSFAATEALAAPRSKPKLCVASGLDGKQTKWKCKGLEKCCYDIWTGKGACVPISAFCMF